MTPKIWLLLLTIVSLLAPQAIAASGDAAIVPALPKKSLQPVLPPKVIRVPLVRQATEYTCGVSALQSVLGYFGEEFREDELAKQLHSDMKDGTKVAEIAGFARKHGFSVTIRTGMTIDDLKKLLNAHTPVIVLIQAWAEHKIDYKADWDDGHYVVAVGYDRGNLFFMDPSTLGDYTYIPMSEFVDRWHDTDGTTKLVHFGMILSKPGSPRYNSVEVKKID
jgi:predicted double-glycine peptidase